jgi:hypothetical protein
MSFESEIEKRLRLLEARIERTEEIYPMLYGLMINLKMMADTNIETGNAVIALMEEIHNKLQKIEHQYQQSFN